MPARTIAIGDIHGCLTALDTLLSAIRPTAEDELILLGDFIDRGPDSRGVVERLIELGGRCRLVSLLGNHEEMLLAARDAGTPAVLHSWLSCGGAATLKSYGPGAGPNDIPEPHIAFIEACIDYYQNDTHLFFHASYDANEPLEDQSRLTLRWESLNDRIPPRHVSGKTAIVGHTSQKTGEVLDRGYLKCIDTYCHGGLWLTALEPATGRIWQANQQGELRATASESH